MIYKLIKRFQSTAVKDWKLITLIVSLSVSLLFFNFNYLYTDDYRIILYNQTLQGFLESYRWGLSRIVGNYFFSLIYLTQSNLFINFSVISVHLLNGLLLYKLNSKFKTVSVIVSLLFISLPITSEAFFWAIAGQVVYAIFFFLSGLYYYKFRANKASIKHILVLSFLHLLSITFYEVLIFFPLIYLIFSVFFRSKKDTVYSLSLSIVSALYIAALKIYTLTPIAVQSAKEKTTVILLSDLPGRINAILNDIFNLFFGEFSILLYSHSLSDTLKIGLHPVFIIALIVTLGILLFSIWGNKKDNYPIIASDKKNILVGLTLLFALIGLLSSTSHYYQGLRTFYPVSLSFSLFLIEILIISKKNLFFHKLLLTGLSVLIIVNIITLKNENRMYTDLYSYDSVLASKLQENYLKGKKTVLYIPGYNHDQPMAAQMYLTYYPESAFYYGFHLMHAYAVGFSNVPYEIYGSKLAIYRLILESPDKYVIYNTIDKTFVDGLDFVSSSIGEESDLTFLHPNNYLLKNAPYSGYDETLIYRRKRHKTFVLHANCSNEPAFLELLIQPQEKTCFTSFSLLDVHDIRGESTSDGTELSIYINDQYKDTVKVFPNDENDIDKIYKYNVIPNTSESAKIRYVVSDGGKLNCMDDKVYIVDPVLICE